VERQGLSPIKSHHDLSDKSEVISWWPFAVNGLDTKDAFFDCISVDLESGTKRQTMETDQSQLTGVDFELHSDLTPFFRRDGTKFDPLMIFSYGKFHIILKSRNIKICEHSSLLQLLKY